MENKHLLVHKNRRIWRIATFVLAVISVALLVALIVVSKLKDRVVSDQTYGQEDSGKSITVCGSSNPNGNSIDLQEPRAPGPFHDLTVAEITELTGFLETHPSIRAAKSRDALVNSSYIFQIDLFLPRKSDVINYLDKSGPQPSRQARVIMIRGDLSPPIVEEYICGPLLQVEKCDLINSTSRRNPVEFSVRPVSPIEFKAIETTLLKEVDRQIGYILDETYGATWTQCSKPQDCFFYGVNLLGTGIVGDINQRKMWLSASYNVPYPSVHPVDHGVFLNLNGSDVTNWRIEKIWYAGRQYSTMEHLITEYNNISIPKPKFKKPVYSENLYSTLHRRGEPLPVKPQRPPMQVEPDGKRYSLKNRKVDYMGWSFNFRLSSLSGPAIFDVRYKGERIAYEITLAEIAVLYSGYTPALQITDYVDSGVLLGFHSKALIPGSDCPETATLVNQTFFDNRIGKPVVYESSICLFEHNNGYPLRRHLSYAFYEGSFYGGMTDSVLTFRSALTIENYDYIIDFIFHQNGVFESRFMSTGYILSTTYTEDGRPYGFRIEDNVLGNLHQHLVHFKADLDIGGTTNRYQTLDITPEDTPLATDPLFEFHQTKITPTLKRTEQEALLKYNFDAPKYHLVFNNATRTNYGEFRSYRIQLNGMSKMLFAEGQGNEPTLSWARHQLVVTKHKDEEFLSSSNYGMLDSNDPVVKFDSFYEDDESIDDEDLVFWISSGMHHIPHTEDLPVTPTVGNHLTFFLLPFNYFPECPSMGSRDGIYIKHIDRLNPAKGVKVERYENTRDQCVTPRATLEEDLSRNPDQVLQTRVQD